MSVVAQPAERVRFDCFEANLATSELRKHGVRVKLHDQPFQILAMLVARPGQMVKREEIQQKLWPAGTFVDFENGLNRAVNRLRDALGDSAGEPKFIETIPRHGYRFLVAVERLSGEVPALIETKAAAKVPLARRWRWIAAGVAAGLVAAAVAGWRPHAAPKKALNFGARDWVLITNFENRTGNPVFDGTLEYALARELSNSQYVTVVSSERITDALRLMRKPSDSRIDAALGREICLRDGDIRALLTGRVEKLGTTYVLTAQLMDPVRGVAVASMNEEDPADSQMAAAVRRLSDHVRETLGEKVAQIQQENKQLERVTTPSLHALQLFTQANELMRRDGNWAAGGELLEQALAEDQNFASAHLWLGYALGNQGKLGEAQAEFQRAFDLSKATSDRERLFILASYDDVVKHDHANAIKVYETLLQMYPDHYWAAQNLDDLYVGGGLRDESERLAMRLAELRPDDAYRNQVVACAKYLEKDPNGAKLYIERVKAIAAANPKGAVTADFVNMLPAFFSWSEGNISAAHQQLQEVEKTQEPDFFFHLAFGELAETERRLYLGNEGWDDRNYPLGILEFVKGDLQAARRRFAKVKGEPYGSASTALVWVERSGLWDTVDRVIRKSSRYDSRGSEIVRGELALARGQTKEGVALLEKGIEASHNFPNGAFYLGSETLARAYEKQGDQSAALRVLLQASNAKGRAINFITAGGGEMMNGAMWLRDELQLADLYRKMGRVPEAEQVENELRKMLIYADADHPIVLALKKRERLSAATTVKK